MKTVELLSYIMHHISLPLASSLAHNPDAPNSAEETANTIAALLEKVVLESEELKNILDISKSDKDNLALRLHMASLCAKYIASEYNKTHKIPSDSDIKRHIAAIDASLIFCEDYIPLQKLSDIYPENAHRPASFLKNLADLKYLESTAPIVNAVCQFSFGQTPQKMIQNVSEKLYQHVTDMKDSLIHENLSHIENKEANRYILHNLAELYASAHLQELKRIEGISQSSLDSESPDRQIANIWAAFQMRYDMILELTESILPNDAPPQQGDGDFQSIDNFLDDITIDADAFAPEAEKKLKPMSFYKKK
ncbi:MAG: hypothetical protein ACRBDI_06435 [Alphaproteobacteria bacterium]